jgi:hypothetical protein
MAHEVDSKRALGFVLIVRTATQPHAGHRGLAAARHGLDVIELEELARRAALAVVADERALATITIPDRAPDVCGDVPGTASRARAPRSTGGGELLLLELGNEGVERLLEHLGDVSRRNTMAE